MVERYVRCNGKHFFEHQASNFCGVSYIQRQANALEHQGLLATPELESCFLEKKISSLGFDLKQFGLNSLRARGASAAANAGVPDRLFKRHGRWRSETAKDGYVKDSVPDLLSVSKSLDI